MDFFKDLKDKFEIAPVPLNFHIKTQPHNLPENFKQQNNQERN